MCGLTSIVKVNEFTISKNNTYDCHNAYLHIEIDVKNRHNTTVKFNGYMTENFGCIKANQHKLSKCKIIKK